MGENFAFFLPVMMASFGVVFGFVWSLRVRAAGYWSGAFFCVAGGFAVPAGFALFPTPHWGFVADLLFAGGFLLFSQALLERWRPNWLLWARIGICALSVLLCVVAIALDNLPLELAASDFGCFLLIGLPLIAGRDHLGNWSDRILFGAAALTALDNLVRGSTIPLTLSSGSFLNSDYAFLMQALACVFGLFLALAALAANMLDLLARYQRDAQHDPLSGLLNRRGFDEAIAQRARKLPMQGSMIVCDIDHFKTVNDAHGHALGDRAIVLLAQILARFAPADAITARFGGEEFVLFLPDTHAARAAGIANDIRESIAQEVADELGLSRRLTASFGLSAVQRGDASIHDAIARADAALYEAKTRGRNRVCVRRALAAPDTLATDLKFHAQGA
ncbi:GGDEF domain-containing protein [Sphingobium sp. JS3065]|uniref:GGDEF domain-containing protein n=1 Tax=Sphingobium sp. JS3065 TaxID=2970925 RepID=UPI00226557CB|nr:GGDEF domain-containing protein [Sphingobium sp. JS3065]UZW53766.1 GGDEF domain-containing protein [Sphingobium sp. JS3065]